MHGGKYAKFRLPAIVSLTYPMAGVAIYKSKDSLFCTHQSMSAGCAARHVPMNF
jgi:hypothetical protein